MNKDIVSKRTKPPPPITMFLPCTREEMTRLGWETLDVILVTGDAYIDSPFIGVAVIGKLLVRHGFRVGIIAQPDCRSGDDISRLGETTLFWGITGGSIDSIVANRTAPGRCRKTDAYNPGCANTRQVIAEHFPDIGTPKNLLMQHWKPGEPIIIRTPSRIKKLYPIPEHLVGKTSTPYE